MASLDHKVDDIEQCVAPAFVARSPIDSLIAAKQARGWRKLKLFSDPSGDFTRDYVSKGNADVPDYNVVARRRHHPALLGRRMGGDTAHPGQMPRGGPTSIPCGPSLTPRRKGAAPTGIRSSASS